MKTELEKSKSIAGIVGPTLIVMIVSEMKFWNPTLYDTQIVPLIYLNGVLFFVAGIAIVNNHNIWNKSWQSVVTIIGYLTLIVGLFRMFFPQTQEAEFENNQGIFILQVFLVITGIFLTYKGYSKSKNKS